MKYLLLKSTLSLFLLQFIFSFSYAQSWDKVIKAVADDRENLSFYGSAVSISGNYAVVGAYREDEDANGNNSLEAAGAAYILYNDGISWKQVKKICAPLREANDWFGISVSISGNDVIVGAQNEAQDEAEINTLRASGAAYIFSKDEGGKDAWGLVKKITASTRTADSYFGQSVSINGDYAIIGAYSENTSGINSLNSSGAAYIFRKDQGGAGNWGELKKITASDRAGSDSFGISVSISSNYAIVGAPQESENGVVFGAGAAYIFKKNQGGMVDAWTEVKKLIAPVRADYDYFGRSVSIDGEYAIVGASNESESSDETNTINHSGSAYIFKASNESPENWGLVKKITAKNREANDNFGIAVAISGNYAIVGANVEENDESEGERVENAGSAYIFSKNLGGSETWGQMKKIIATRQATNSNFGNKVAISGAQILIGANLENGDAFDANNMLYSGAVYFFSSSSPLPVILAGFYAVKQENQALISWTTTSESNSHHFEIQRSAEGRNWIIIESITAAQESTGLKSYSFIDKAPLNGENLYRLKMVDNDDTFTYSVIKNLAFNNKADIIFYPNPASGKIYFTGFKANKIQSIKMISTTGKVMLQSQSLVAGNEISIQHLQPGLYILQTTQVDGQSEFSKVIVVK